MPPTATGTPVPPASTATPTSTLAPATSTPLPTTTATPTSTPTLPVAVPTRIGVGGDLHFVAVNPITNQVFFDDYSGRRVIVLDAKTNKFIAHVTVGNGPARVAVNPVTNRIYSGNSTGNNVSVVDGNTWTVIATVKVGADPYSVAVNPATNRIYAANYSTSANSVSVIDGNSNSVIATIGVGTAPQGLAINPNTNRIYVSNRNANTVSVIDGNSNSVIATIPVAKGPFSLTANPATNRVYVGSYNSNTVSVIDGGSNTVIATIGGFSAPYGISFNPNTNHLFVSNSTANSVSVVDTVTNTVIGTYTSTIDGAVDVVVNPSMNTVYQADYQISAVSIFQDNWPVTQLATATPLPASVTSTLTTTATPPLLTATSTATLTTTATATATDTATATATPAPLSASPVIAQAGDTLTATWTNVPNPTQADWIGLFPQGASDTAYAAWSWVNCTNAGAASQTAAFASGSCAFTAPSPPRAYEFRFFANNSSAHEFVSNTVAVGPGLPPTPTPSATATPTATTPPATLSAAGSVAAGPGTVSWTNAANPSASWFAFYRPEFVDADLYDTWAYLTCGGIPGPAPASGSCSVVLPPYASDYVVKLWAQDDSGATVAIATTTITLAAPTDTPTPSPTASATSTVTQTATVTVTPTATARATETPAASNTPSATPTGTATPTPTAANTSLPSPTPTASSTPANPAFRVASGGSVTAGDQVTVTWANLTDSAWFGLYAASNLVQDNWFDWWYLPCTRSEASFSASGSCTLTLSPPTAPWADSYAPGSYVLQLWQGGTLAGQDSLTMIAPEPTPPAAPPGGTSASVTTSQTNAVSGSTVAVRVFSSDANRGTYRLVLGPSGGGSSVASKAFGYTASLQTGGIGMSFPIPSSVPPGSYRFQLVDPAGVALGTAGPTLSIAAPAISLQLAQSSAVQGATIKVGFSTNDPRPGAYHLFLVPSSSGSPIQVLNTSFTAAALAALQAKPASETLSITSKVPPGDYTFRVTDSANFVMLSPIRLTVVAPAMTAALSTDSAVQGSKIGITLSTNDPAKGTYHVGIAPAGGGKATTLLNFPSTAFSADGSYSATVSLPLGQAPGSYVVQVTDPGGSVLTTDAGLTVLPPTFSLTLDSNSAVQGAPVGFTFATTDLRTGVYHLRMVPTGGGAATPLLTWPTSSPPQAAARHTNFVLAANQAPGSYLLQATDPIGAVFDTGAVLTVVAPTATLALDSATLVQGAAGQVTFSTTDQGIGTYQLAMVPSGGGATTILTRIAFTAVPGSTSYRATFTLAWDQSPGDYGVELIDPSDTVLSATAAATLTVVPPSATISPTLSVAVPGQRVSFSFSANDPAAGTYYVALAPASGRSPRTVESWTSSGQASNQQLAFDLPWDILADRYAWQVTDPHGAAIQTTAPDLVLQQPIALVAGPSRATPGQPIDLTISTTSARPGEYELDVIGSRQVYPLTGQAGQGTFLAHWSWSAGPSPITAALPANLPVDSYTFQLIAPIDGPLATYGTTLAVENPVPAVTALSPTSGGVGTATTVTINGHNFVPGSVVSWDGMATPATYVSATQLTVSAPRLSQLGPAFLTVTNPSPGGGTSRPLAFFATLNGTQATTSSGTSYTPDGHAVVSVGQPLAPGSLAGQATGIGTLTLAKYSGNPLSTPAFGPEGGWFDINASAGNSFSQVTVVNCNLGAGHEAFWWTGSAWRLMSNQSWDAATHCLTMTFDASTSPSIVQLNGTVAEVWQWAQNTGLPACIGDQFEGAFGRLPNSVTELESWGNSQGLRNASNGSWSCVPSLQPPAAGNGVFKRSNDGHIVSGWDEMDANLRAAGADPGDLDHGPREIGAYQRACGCTLAPYGMVCDPSSYLTVNGPRTIDQMRSELASANYPNWSQAGPQEIAAVYGRTTGGPVSLCTTGEPGPGGATPVPTPGGPSFEDQCLKVIGGVVVLHECNEPTPEPQPTPTTTATPITCKATLDHVDDNRNDSAAVDVIVTCTGGAMTFIIYDLSWYNFTQQQLGDRPNATNIPNLRVWRSFEPNIRTNAGDVRLTFSATVTVRPDGIDTVPIDVPVEQFQLDSVVTSPTYTVNGTRFPHVAAHIRAALTHNWPADLHYESNPLAAARNRTAACSAFRGELSCDEYPFAATKEGGLGASCADVDLNENTSQGGDFGRFIFRNGLVDNDQFQITVVGSFLPDPPQAC